MIGRGVDRRKLAVLFVGVSWFALGALPLLAGAETNGMKTIHATTDWYRARPEHEEAWRGQLHRRDALAGPSSRPALRYTLQTSLGPRPVYDPEASPILASLIGRLVAARGKLVDLTAEGFGQELWIGEIGTAP
jgi:hypothetical protein